MFATLPTAQIDDAGNVRGETIKSRTYHYVRPLDPACDAAWKARAQACFEENRALAARISARRVAIILAGGDPDAMPSQLAMAA